MPVWMTEKLMRWSLRSNCGRFLWKRCFQVTASMKDFPTYQPVCLFGSKQYQKSLSRSLVSTQRFHSQGGNHHEANSHLSSQLAELSSPPEVHLDGTASDRSSPFMSHLQQCRTPSDVLDLTCKYMTQERQISTCLTCMWSSLKTMSKEQRRYESQLMFEHPEFDKFLQRVMSSVQHMHSNDVVHSLLSMINMGVPHRSRVIQTFLRACQVGSSRSSTNTQRRCSCFKLIHYIVLQQENLNDFDDKSLSILASCLVQMEDGPNVKALKEGIKYEITKSKCVHQRAIL